MSDKLVFIWNIFAMTIIAIIILLFVNYILQPKHVVGYSLSGGVGVYSIRVDIENHADDIVATPGVSLERMVVIIDSLNKTLPHIQEQN